MHPGRTLTWAIHIPLCSVGCLVQWCACTKLLRFLLRYLLTNKQADPIIWLADLVPKLSDNHRFFDNTAKFLFEFGSDVDVRQNLARNQNS